MLHTVPPLSDFPVQGQHSDDCSVSDKMVQVFVRSDKTYCVDVPAASTVSDFLYAFEDVAGESPECSLGVVLWLPVWRAT